jgi:hypothetical protein
MDGHRAAAPVNAERTALANGTPEKDTAVDIVTLQSG